MIVGVQAEESIHYSAYSMDGTLIKSLPEIKEFKEHYKRRLVYLTHEGKAGLMKADCWLRNFKELENFTIQKMH